MIRGGASLVGYRPVFSADGRLLLVCTGCTVCIFSVATGLLVNQLHGHTDTVTSIVVVQFSGSSKSALNHAWSSSLDGIIRLWDFDSGAVIKSVMVGRPVVSMVIPGLSVAATKVKSIVAFVSVKYEKTSVKSKVSKLQGRVILHDLNNGMALKGHLAKTVTPRLLETSRTGGLVGMVDNTKIWVWKVPSRPFGSANSVEVTLLHHVRLLQVLAFGPTDTVVAAGDETGRILVWQNIGESTFGSGDAGSEERKIGWKRQHDEVPKLRAGSRSKDDAEALTTYHWHSHQVNFLTFSVDGVYLLSGGLEAVLVMWQIETGKKDFLPRLGGSLSFITSSPDPSFFSVSCTDNSIIFVDIGSRSVERSIQGIKPSTIQPCKSGFLKKPGVIIEPGEGKLVLPTDNLSIQLYDILRDRHVSEIQVCPRNYIPVSDKTKRPTPPSVTVSHVAFSGDGTVMVTVDSRLSEEGLGGSSHLKFWDRDIGSLRYTENTVVLESSAEISALTYHPTKHMVVSCMPSTAEFKVWVQEKRTGLPGEGKQFRWGCRSVGSYRRKSIASAAFSSDGSILAVAAEELVTLWNPVTNGIVTVLTSSPPQPISALAFIPKSLHLIALSHGKKAQLVVWNLETITVFRSYNFRVEALAVDPTSPHFAVLLKGSGSKKSPTAGNLAVFNLEKDSPIAAWRIRDARGGNICFLPSNLPPAAETQVHGSRLLFSTATREYVLLDPHSSEDTPAELVAREKRLPEIEAPSAFLSMYGKKPERPKSQRQSLEASRIKSNRPWGTILDSPSHILPPLTKIGPAFIESMLDKLDKLASK